MVELSHDLFSLLTLLFLEIILGLDNLVFVSITSQTLPQQQQNKARQLGLVMALGTRLLLLFFLNNIAGYTTPLFTLADFSLSTRDLLLAAGGLFLLYKSTGEIHNEVTHNQAHAKANMSSFFMVICQIAILDIVFSLDSVITAIAMTSKLVIMCLAIILAMLLMIVASNPVSHFIEKNPTVKMLALSFILMIGMVLVADGFHYHVPRAYIYFAITFSLFVESMNILANRKRQQRRRQP